jgi:hypothetical protein
MQYIYINQYIILNYNTITIITVANPEVELHGLPPQTSPLRFTRKSIVSAMQKPAGLVMS